VPKQAMTGKRTIVLINGRAVKRVKKSNSGGRNPPLHRTIGILTTKLHRASYDRPSPASKKKECGWELRVLKETALKDNG